MKVKRRSRKAFREQARIEEIGPEKAAMYLGTMCQQRNLRIQRVSYLADEMTAGRFLLTNDAITFNRRGELINGQHRLRAVIASGKPQRFLVLRQVTDDTIYVLDVGGLRTDGDHFKLAGVDLASRAAIGVRLLHDILYADPIHPIKVNANVLLSMSLRHPRIQDFIRLAMQEGGSGARLISETIIGPLAYVVSFEDDEFSNLMLHRLLTGDGLRSGDPLHTAREKIIRLKATGLLMRRQEILPLLVRAINCNHRGERVSKLYLNSKVALEEELIGLAACREFDQRMIT